MHHHILLWQHKHKHGETDKQSKNRKQGNKVPLHLTCRVLHTKSLLSSPQTLCAATTNTRTRNTKTMDSQILPNAVEYLLTPLNRLSSPDQFIPAAALDTSAPYEAEEERNLFTDHKCCIDISSAFLCHISNNELWLRISHKLPKPK